jgi:hypothetical protein
MRQLNESTEQQYHRQLIEEFKNKNPAIAGFITL